MAGIPSGHQHRARRRADGVAAIVAGEDHPFAGEAIDVRRADDLLAVVADFTVAEVIGQDEHDVRSRLRAEAGAEQR